MLSSTSTACGGLSLKSGQVLFASVFLLACMSFAQDTNLRVPSNAVAGQATSIATTGSGSATFYLTGPSLTVKRDVQLGQDIQLTAAQVQSAGRYIATICGGTCS